MFSIVLFSLITFWDSSYPLNSILEDNRLAFVSDTKDGKSYDCMITGTGVRMRESPSLQGKIIGSFRNEEWVELLRYSNNNEWARIRRSSGKIGWVNSNYISCACGG